jgi:hypothetical protein
MNSKARTKVIGLILFATLFQVMVVRLNAY